MATTTILVLAHLIARVYDCCCCQVVVVHLVVVVAICRPNFKGRHGNSRTVSVKVNIAPTACMSSSFCLSSSISRPLSLVLCEHSFSLSCPHSHHHIITLSSFERQPRYHLHCPLNCSSTFTKTEAWHLRALIHSFRYFSTP